MITLTNYVNGELIPPDRVHYLDSINPSAGEVHAEEIFGPIATIMPFADEAKALALANGTPYGLSAVLRTSHLGRAHRMAAAGRYRLGQ